MKRTLFAMLFLAALSLTALSVTYAELPDDAPVSHGVANQFTGMGSSHVVMGLPSILAVIDSREEFTNFRKAVERANMTETLDSKGPFTVFVPTDEAFNRLPTAEEEAILRDPQSSKAVVLSQMTDGYLLYGASGPQDLSRVGFIITENGSRIPIIVERRNVKVGQSHLITANIRASNGIIHVVDRVTLPESNSR